MNIGIAFQVVPQGISSFNLLVLSGIYMVQIQVSSQVCSSDGQIVLI